MKKDEDLDYEVLDAKSSESYDVLDKTVSSSEFVSGDPTLRKLIQNSDDCPSDINQNPKVREFGPDEEPRQLELNTIESMLDEEEEK